MKDSNEGTPVVKTGTDRPTQKLTVRELAEQTGNLTKNKNDNVFVPSDLFTPQHAAAAFAHGWIHHERATGKQFELSLEDYQAALAATDADRSPHPAALSKFAPPPAKREVSR
jgi:hypothetical protein